MKDPDMNQHLTLTPDSDYDTIRAAIRYLSENGPDTTDLDRFARALGLTERQLTDLFRRWCGLSPKSFAQAVALDHAKSLLRDKASVLDATYEVGLSSTSRLHDLFVTYEAMPPGVHPIIPVMLGDAKLAQAMAARLFDEGVYVSGFFFPVVPKGQARIRTQMNAALTREELTRALGAFERAGKACGVI